MADDQGSPPGRRRTTEDFGIEFGDDGLAIGWAFGVSTAFRKQLGIEYAERVDRERTAERRRRAGGSRTQAGALIVVKRWAWVRGLPPLRSFSEGDALHDPPQIRSMVWRDALQDLRRSVQITAATPDQENGTDGIVTFDLRHYRDGTVVDTSTVTCSQADFETFLRTGRLQKDI